METTPKTAQEIAADIADELRQHPEHWTTHMIARNGFGDKAGYDEPDAVCWCLMGHILRRLGTSYKLSEVQEPFFAAAGLSSRSHSFADINDCRTVDEIIGICDLVAKS